MIQIGHIWFTKTNISHRYIFGKMKLRLTTFVNRCYNFIISVNVEAIFPRMMQDAVWQESACDMVSIRQWESHYPPQAFCQWVWVRVTTCSTIHRLVNSVYVCSAEWTLIGLKATSVPSNSFTHPKIIIMRSKESFERKVERDDEERCRQLAKHQLWNSREKRINN